ncbi:VOC family protein [Myxococcota bacterium]|nr:VOC family protein [Myxococcota bacterium]
MSHTPTPHLEGRITWRELMFRDLDANVAFYTQLFGWTVHEEPMPDGVYRIFKAGEKMVAGLLPIGPGMEQVPPCWMAYVKVGDVADTAERVRAAGGQVLAGPQQIPGWGSFLVLADPQGGVINAFDFPAQDAGDPSMPAPGEFCWESLNTTDVAAATAFYASALGWHVADFGGFPVFLADRVQVASVTPVPPGVPAHWLSYVAVPDLAASRARIVELGGEVLVEEIQVPGVGAFAVARSPEGAVFCPFQGG